MFKPDMLRRLLPAFMVLAFASQILAGALACTKGDHSTPAEMACCALAKSATASPAALICCQTNCGEQTNGTPGSQSESTVRPQAPPSVPAVHPMAAVNHLLFSMIQVSTTHTAILYHDPPALYLHNSAFLI